MKHYASIILYDKDKSKPHHRENFELDDITLEEYDYEKHVGKLFIFPDGPLDKNTLIYAWQWCISQSPEEDDELVKSGKMIILNKSNILVPRNF